jgi:hypothetical protein
MIGATAATALAQVPVAQGTTHENGAHPMAGRTPDRTQVYAMSSASQAGPPKQGHRATSCYRRRCLADDRSNRCSRPDDRRAGRTASAPHRRTSCRRQHASGAAHRRRTRRRLGCLHRCIRHRCCNRRHHCRSCFRLHRRSCFRHRSCRSRTSYRPPRGWSRASGGKARIASVRARTAVPRRTPVRLR